ncbi:putative indole-3-pyruvate monooxygenase YUCCA11 [Bidens hawaiensis]|uniref:putative indole-3-pyruvate monooxygenase YUCCA11 n=1 Tax=Bidens hawaiensis TaxID=980011 RepID=UPI00404954CF
MKQETVVVIVGAGPAGIATSACLNLLSILNIVLERENCYASLWQKKAYDRLKLHLAKNFCELPHIFGHKDVLVVGAGNSGMEIAYDLYNWGAQTSIVVRSPIHVLSKELVQLGMYILKYIPCSFVDKMVLMLSKLLYGDLGVYGIQRPFKGPFTIKKETGRSPIIDVGTISKIKTGDIEFMTAIEEIKGDQIKFTKGKERQFDAIVFATGFKSTVRKWLKDDGGLFNGIGMPKHKSPNHWKGEHGLYCVGFASAGLFGISNDAKNIAGDIFKIIHGN